MVGLDVSTSVDAEGLTVGLLVGTEVGEDIGVADGIRLAHRWGSKLILCQWDPWTVTRSECR